MPENDPPATPPGKTDSSWETIKKKVLNLRLTLSEAWLILGTVFGAGIYLYKTYDDMQDHFTKIESQLKETTEKHQASVMGLRDLVNEMSKRTDHLQEEVNRLKK